MRRLRRIILRAVAMVAWCGGFHDASAQINGEWRGAIRHAADWHATRLRLHGDGARVTGTIDVYPMSIRGAAVEGTLEGTKLVLKFNAKELAGVTFEGALENNALRSAAEGTWRTPGFQFIRMMEMPAAAYDEYAGWYEETPGSPTLVTRGAEAGLRFYRQGRISGTLLPFGKDHFNLTHFDQAPTTLRNEARFIRDANGKITQMEVGENESGKKNVLRRLASHPIRQEQIAFQNEGVRLRGLLLSPADALRHPAIVFLQGTGYSTTDRPYEMSLVQAFLAKGIAVLLYDKRGCGGSSGDWRTSSLEELAGDAVAAVKTLGARKDVVAQQVGVYGISEGGWVAVAAAAKSREVAYVVNQGGPAVSPLEDEMDDLTAGIGGIGFQGEDLEVAMNLGRAMVELYRSHDGLVQFQSAREKASKKPWFRNFESRIPKGEEDWEVQWWRKRGRLDSVSLWKSSRVPSLVLIGEKDNTMDVKKNIGHFQEIKRTNNRLELRVISAADHGLRVAGKLVDGFPDFVAEWILQLKK